jgi:predicted  nucleic acid-binding Zn-ribbon protein
VDLTKVSNPKSPKDYADLVALRKKTKEDAKKKAKALEKAELKVEKTKRELAEVDSDNKKEQEKIKARLEKAEKALTDLKPPVVGSAAPLTELKSPVE